MSYVSLNKLAGVKHDRFTDQFSYNSSSVFNNVRTLFDYVIRSRLMEV